MSSEEIKGPQQWKVEKQDGSRLEPANLHVLRQWIASGQIQEDDRVINEDLADWVLASEAPELYDLFKKQVSVTETPPPPGDASPHAHDDEIEVPDCAFHAGRKATEICVGCGKFICEECREHVERKVYCRTCMAEKNVGIEPGAPVGPGALSESITATPLKVATSRLAIASLVATAFALLATIGMILPKINIGMSPLAGFLAFMAALLGVFAFNRIRTSGGSLRGRGLALTGLIAGCVLFACSLTVVTLYAKQSRIAGAGRGTSDLRGEDSRLSGLSAEGKEALAQELYEEVRKYVSQGQLDRAVNVCKTILDRFPDTPTGKRVKDRLPLIEEALAAQMTESDIQARQNEDIARQRLEHAIAMYSDGDFDTSIELLRSIVENFPKTSVAEEAKAELARIEGSAAEVELQKSDSEASQVASQAALLMDSRKYEEAADLYRKILDEYQQTPTAKDAGSKLKEVELILKDPSEKEFYEIQKESDKRTYEESISLLSDFLARHSDCARCAEAGKLIAEYKTKKNSANSLYKFGETYFEDGKYNLALGRFGKLIKDYPQSRWIPQAREKYEESLKKLEE